MVIIVKLTKKQKTELSNDCKTMSRGMSTSLVTKYYDRAVKILEQLHESHALDYTEYNSMLNDLNDSYQKSLPFAVLNDQVNA